MNMSSRSNSSVTMWSDRTAASCSQIPPSVVTGVDFTLDKKALSIGNRGKWTTVTKMISVIMLPVVALIFLSASALASAISVMSTTNIAIGAINNFLNFDQAVTNLQIERGTSAQFLSSDGDNMAAFQSLIQFRVETDNALRAISPWPAADFIKHANLPNAESLIHYMGPYRKRVNANNVSVEDAISFYTEIDTYFMDWTDLSIVLPDKGNMWTTLVAISAMLRASDYVGIQRALGASFFTTCGFSSKTELWFTYLEGAVAATFSFAFDNNRAASDEYAFAYVGSQLQRNINTLKANMASPQYMKDCATMELAERYSNSDDWFEELTAYITVLKDIRGNIREELLQNLDAVKVDSQAQLGGYSAVMVLVSVACISLSVWYAGRIYNMISSITRFAKRIALKSKDIIKEKEKSEGLLHEMLPKAVAEKLKANQEVKAEYYEVVTIYFSDIVSFTTLSAKSSPMQVVLLLNSLYSLFDQHIDSHNVYKVETIGDAYMVVGGVPDATPRHAIEIALMSLQLLESLSHFQVPHMPGERLQIRIGLHTGSVVTGVVGSKMPRYCLFGTHVYFANLMESSGRAQRIHVSEAVKKALTLSASSYQRFRFSEGEPIEYGVMGTVDTFFLDGYDDLNNPTRSLTVPTL